MLIFFFLRHVKTLVGEIDFSFHVVSTADESGDDSSTDSLLAKKDVEEEELEDLRAAERAKRV